MRIPADIFYSQLKKSCPLRTVYSGADRFVQGVFFASSDTLREEQVYIMEEEDYLSLAFSLARSVILMPAAEEPKGINTANDLILLPENISRRDLFNRVQAIFSDYQSWADEVQECTPDYAGIQKMMNLTGRRMKASLILVDNDMQYLYYTKDFLRYPFLARGSTSRPAETTVQMALEEQKFLTIQNEKEPFLFPSEGHPYAALCYNLFNDQHKTQGRLMVLRENPVYTPDDAFILQFIGVRIARILRTISIRSFPLDTYRRFRVLLKELLTGANPPEDEENASLSDIGWQNGERFCLFALRPGKGTVSAEMEEVLCRQMETLFQDVFCRAQEGTLYMIARRRDLFSLEDLKQQAAKAAERYHFVMSVSPVFEQFAHLRFVKTICDRLFPLGQQGSGVVYRFEDLGLSYLRKYGTDEMPAVLLRHPAVNILEKFDADRGTPYIKTLRVWLDNNQSPTHGARALYIHRSTLLDRLENIRNIAGLPKDLSPEERLYLSLSLTL